MKSINSHGFEDFVFHKAFGIVWVLIRGSFSRMWESALDCIEHITNAWRKNESFLSFGTLKCLIVTGMYGSIALSYLVITSFTIVGLAFVVTSLFLLLTALFAAYQVLIGIMFGIVDAFKAYIYSLIKYTFKA